MTAISEDIQKDLQRHKNMADVFYKARDAVDAARDEAERLEFLAVSKDGHNIDDVYNMLDGICVEVLTSCAHLAVQATREQKKEDNARKITAIRSKFREGRQYKCQGVTVTVLNRFRNAQGLFIFIKHDINDTDGPVAIKLNNTIDGGEAILLQGRIFTPRDVIFTDEECERLGVTND